MLLGTLRSNDTDDSENVKKTIGLISKTTTSHVHHTFCTFLPRFCTTYDVKMPNFAFYGGRKQPTTEFYFSFWAWNSASGGFAYNWQSKWVGIIAMKTERTQIHFLSDVLVAVASLDLKVPNNTAWRRHLFPWFFLGEGRGGGAIYRLSSKQTRYVYPLFRN